MLVSFRIGKNSSNWRFKGDNLQIKEKIDRWVISKIHQKKSTLQTYILLTCKPGREKEVIKHLRSIKGVMEVNGIWGKYDIFVKVEHDAEFGLDRFVEILRKIENITSTYTMPVLFGQGGTIDD